MDSPVPSSDHSGPSASGPSSADAMDEDDEDDAEALKAHISKMKSAGNASAGSGEVLARSVKCSEVSFLSFLGSGIRDSRFGFGVRGCEIWELGFGSRDLGRLMEYLSNRLIGDGIDNERLAGGHPSLSRPIIASDLSVLQN